MPTSEDRSVCPIPPIRTGKRVYATPPDSEKLAKRAVDRWNRMYPIGTPVTLHFELNEPVTHTITASHAEIAYGKKSAIIWLDGIESCQRLSSVHPSYVYCHECMSYPCSKSAAIEQCMKDQGFNEPFRTVASGCCQFAIWRQQ